MDAVTYPTKEVTQFVMDHMVPFRIDINDQSFYERYQTIWTPTTLVLDYNGKEIQRTIGFFPPNELIPMLLLGIAKVRLSFEDFAAANLSLKGLIERFPKSDVIPEAIYYRGVNFYKKTNDLTELKKAYETLLTDYPDSSWAKRAAPYRLI